MKQVVWELREHTEIAKNTYLMRLSGDTSSLSNPGQFVEVSLPGFYLRRPFSVCDYKENEATLIYKVLGQGTKSMTAYEPGLKLDVLCGLGNGFDLEKSGDKPLLIGGGVGVPPLYRLCKELREQGKEVTVVLGFNTREEVFYEREFSDLGAQVTVCTMDGSLGQKGLVTDACQFDEHTYSYACGPLPMLKAICQQSTIPGEVSLEERMGCGFGACMGCTVMTVNGPKRVCKEGPVFLKEALTW